MLLNFAQALGSFDSLINRLVYFDNYLHSKSPVTSKTIKAFHCIDAIVLQLYTSKSKMKMNNYIYFSSDFRDKKHCLCKSIKVSY